MEERAYEQKTIAKRPGNRLLIEAVLWIARTGSPWPDLFPAFGDWHSVYTRYSRWGKKGGWKPLLEQVSDDIDLEQLLLDSIIIRVHQHSAGVKKKGLRLSVARLVD